MFKDEIVEKIYKFCCVYFKFFNYDLQVMYEDIKRREVISGCIYVIFNVYFEKKYEEIFIL